MLRITTETKRGKIFLSVEGRLAGPWVAALEQCWRELRAASPREKFHVNLCGVSFIDAAGKVLLMEIHRQGGQLIAEGCLNQAIATRGFMGSNAPLPRFSSPISHAMLRWTAFGPDASPAQVAFYERMLIAMPPQARADVGIAISEIELYDALPRLTVPTIVLTGENDRLTVFLARPRDDNLAQRAGRQVLVLRRINFREPEHAASAA